MQQMNWMVIALAALIPLVMGFIWYNPKVVGNAWMKSAGMTEDKMKGGNMALIFILTYVFSFMVALILNPVVIHQYGLMSVVMDQPGMMEGDKTSEAYLWLQDAMNKYGHSFRTFKHGAFHATIVAIMLVLPVFGINAMFERRGAKYVMINVFYWIITLALMGGVICQWT